MKRLLILGLMLCGLPVLSAEPKTYQVTGPVLQVQDDLIVVQKGKEKWELGRNAQTQVTGELKPGSVVTIQYRMTAVLVGAKEAKAGKAAAKASK